MTFSWPPKIDLPGYRPVTAAHAKQIREAAQPHRRGQQARAVRRRRRHPRLTRVRGARASSPRLTGAPVVTTLMARGAFPDSHPQHVGMPGMHGTVSAVTALQQSDLLITLGARFDDRVTGKSWHLRAERQGHPRRHRPGRDLQEPHGRRADRRRRAQGDHRPELTDAVRTAVRAVRHPGHSRTWWSLPATACKETYPLGLRPNPTTGCLAPQHVIERIGALTGPEGHLRRRRWPAPDVGRAVHQVRAPQRLAELRRRRHHGLRGPRRHGRQGRRARPRGVGDRRRRLLPDDQPGARHLRASTTSRSRSRSSTTRRWAWCASGRPCSTTAATPTPT